MKTTAFTKYHIAAGAKMAEFAGYNMPIEFSGINDEHMTVREKCGVFDVSHMGEIWIKGEKALDLLQHIASNDVSKLYDGKVQYATMPNGKGGIVDDILIYKFSDTKYMLCVNAANTDKDWAHICAEGEKFGMKPGVELENASDNIAQLAIQGPLAMKLVQKMCEESVEDMTYYTFKMCKLAGCDVILGNEEDAEKVFGIKPEGFDVTATHGEVNAAEFESVCTQLMAKFPRAKKVIITLRGSINANHNTWGGVLYSNGTLYQSPRYDITHIVDRVGGGDSFMGGLLYGLISYPEDDQKALNFAVAASCLKHTIYGDFNQVTVAEVENLMKGDGSGRVSR